MTLQKIEFEYDIPDGYRFVRYGDVTKGCQYVNVYGSISTSESDQISKRLIVEKIPETESKKHRWHDLMIELANDKTLRFECRDPSTESWFDAPQNPTFYEDIEYRKKPTKKTLKFRNYKFFDIYNKTKIAVHYSGDDMEPEKLANFIGWVGDWYETEI